MNLVKWKLSQDISGKIRVFWCDENESPDDSSWDSRVLYHSEFRMMTFLIKDVWNRVAKNPHIKIDLPLLGDKLYEIVTKKV